MFLHIIKSHLTSSTESTKKTAREAHTTRAFYCLRYLLFFVSNVLTNISFFYCGYDNHHHQNEKWLLINNKIHKSKSKFSTECVYMCIKRKLSYVYLLNVFNQFFIRLFDNDIVAVSAIVVSVLRLVCTSNETQKSI